METPAGISAAPLRYRHIPLSGAPGRQARRLTRSDGRARERQAGRLLPAPACVCSARRGCHSCDAIRLPSKCTYLKYLDLLSYLILILY